MSRWFQDWQVYRLAEEVSEEIWKILGEEQPLAKDTLGKQMISSLDSIGANLAEGVGRGSFQDNKRFVKIARGSLSET
ncbi:MAG: four helix bundle protein [Chroococcales cyanobacterium]